MREILDQFNEANMYAINQIAAAEIGRPIYAVHFSDDAIAAFNIPNTTYVIDRISSETYFIEEYIKDIGTRIALELVREYLANK